MLILPDFYKQKYFLIKKKKFVFENRKKQTILLKNNNILMLKQKNKIYKKIKNLLSWQKWNIKKRMHQGNKIFKYWFSNKIARATFALAIPKNIINEKDKYIYLEKKIKKYIENSKKNKKLKIKKNINRKTKTKLFLKKYVLFKNWKFLDKKLGYQKKTIYYKNIKKYKNFIYNITNINKNFIIKKIKNKYVYKK